jgi:hypothetical protein
MKTILAHWKKDLASARTNLAIWICCVGVIVVFGVARHLVPEFSSSLFQANADSPAKAITAFIALFTGVMGLFGLQFVLLALLIVRIVQQDPLVDPDAWWRTRPISGLSLLAAKALSVGMLLIGAMLCFGAMGLESPSWSSSWLPLLVFAAGLVAFASLTKSLSSLILNWLAIGVGAGFLSSIVLAFWKHSSPVVQGAPGVLSPHINVALDANSTSPLFSLLYLAGFLATIFCQYLKSSTNVSRAILFTTFLLVFLVKG